MLHKVVVSELFGQIDLELKLDNSRKLTVFTAANGYGKTTLLQLIDAFYHGDLPYICSIDFNHIKFYLTAKDSQNKFNIHSVCFTKTQATELSYTICDEQSGQISDPYLFDLNDFSSQLPAEEVEQICQSLTLQAETQINIWGNDEYAQTCHNATVNQFPEAVNWHQQLYPDDLKALLSPIKTHFIDANRLEYQFEQANTHEPSRYGDDNPLTLIEQCAGDLAFQFQQKQTQYLACCDKLNNSFATRLINENTEYGRLETNTWLSQYQTLHQTIEQIISLGILEREQVQLAKPDELRKDDAKLLALYVQDSKVKFSPFEKYLDKVQLFTAMVNHNLSFKAIKVDAHQGFTLFDDNQHQLELCALSEGEQHLVVLLYQIIMLFDDHNIVLIDTPETGLSSQWQNNLKAQLLELSKSYSGQFIIATHSANLIGDEKALQTKRCIHCGQLH